MSVCRQRLNWLITSFGINETPLRWLQSYLTDRTQSVQCSGQSTSPRHVKYGVPQGSVLGPLLFLILDAGAVEFRRLTASNFHGVEVVD